MRAKIAFLGLGLVFLLIGLYLYEQTDVRCGGVSMHPGDSCQVTNNGHSKMMSYDQERSADQQNNIIYIVIGGLMTAVAAGLVVKEAIAGRSSDPSALAFIGQQAEPTPPADQIVSEH